MKLNSQHKRSICTNSCEASSHGTCFSSVTLGYLKRKCVSVSRRRIPKILKSNILNKVCGCYLVTFLNQTAIFDWCVVRWGSRNNHHKDTCFKRVRTSYVFKLTEYSTLNSAHNWEAQYIQSRNQPTCTFKSHNYIREIRFSIWLFCWCFMIANLLNLMQHKVLLCNSNW